MDLLYFVKDLHSQLITIDFTGLHQQNSSDFSATLQSALFLAVPSGQILGLVTKRTFKSLDIDHLI